MRYPPAVTFTPGVSWVYRVFAVLNTILLIALCAVLAGGNGQFSIRNTMPMALAGLACIWLAQDAFRRPPGSLRYAQGQWYWLSADQEFAGTCVLHLDLQSYILVRFTKQPATRSLFSKATQWFHLEARHEDPAAGIANGIADGRDAWMALRRALHAPASAMMAENAQPEFGMVEPGAAEPAHEKRGL